MTRYNLNPSLIARYFYHDCERYLRYHATPLNERNNEGIPEIEHDQNPIMRILLKTGIEWEEEVITDKLGDNVIVPEGEGALNERAHTFAETLDIIKGIKSGQNIYQPTIHVPKQFLKKYNLSSDLYRFPPCRPDLIRLIEDNEKNVLQIIDIKASDDITPSHRVQTALYSLMLQESLKEQGFDIKVDLKKAGIWLYEQDEPELFDLHFDIKMVENFLQNHLPVILKSPIDKLSWHLYHRCELCEFYRHCKSEAEENDSVSMIPYLSSSGKKYLCNDRLSLNSLSELESFLKKDNAEKYLEDCGSLRNQGHKLLTTTQALKNNEPVLTDRISLNLPINEGVALFITIQNDPVSSKIYAIGYRRFKGKQVYENTTNENIYIANNPDECTDIQKKFLIDLYDELKILHDYNREREWSEQKSLQTYVFDSYELQLFYDLLNDFTKDYKMAPVALRLLFYFQNTKLAGQVEHPSTEIKHPTVVLTNEIDQLVSLPVPFSLRLPEISKVLQSPDFNYDFEPSGLFWFEQSNVMKSDAITMVWDGTRPEATEWIKNELSKRLLATSSVLEGLRYIAKDKLITWSQKFKIPDSYYFENKELSKLSFLTRYESYMAAMDIREKRSLPKSERIREGISVPVECMGLNIWRVTKPIDYTLFEKNEEFSHILVPENEEGEKAQISFDDYTFRSEINDSGNTGVNFAIIDEKKVDPKDGKLKLLYLDVKYNNNQEHFNTGDKAVLHPRFTDFTSRRIMRKLRELDELDDSGFLELIRTPQTFNKPIYEADNLLNEALYLSDSSGFTSSQMKAFEHMVNNRLTLVWGPPGTGKTYFLSKSVLNILQTWKNKSYRFHIAITASTHAAIENLLLKIQEISNDYGFDDLPVYKLKSAKTASGKRSLQVCPEYEVDDLLSIQHLVVGGTVNSLDKIGKKIPTIDMLIVDEASQVKPAEIALGMSIIDYGKRLVLAGDDLQLPPIINGDYPESDDELPGLHDSIFFYLRHRDSENNPYTYQLLENWRMNKTLSRFSAETLYGLDYKPATDEIGLQKLEFGTPLQTNGLTESYYNLLVSIVDTEYPLTVCILENVQASVENEIEAEIVSRLSVLLRDNLLSEDGRYYPDNEEGDRKFWKEGLFIVSPHHSQIRTIHNHLDSLRRWNHHPFVDTVDKMQGQESQAVIVSYGVSDVETALNEAEFIYSLNRLNVSVTRAKSKCVLFLPRPLLEPSVELLQNEDASSGFHHMLNLIDFCRKYGKKESFELDFDGKNGVNLTVLKGKY
ncbi:MAG: AAA domain-containing protein [Methanohalobium sp.]|uniref:AAA domain-containing protein n=1 Tax=Methanohalobium sp. TaxID=2837493 RepID=UPI003979A462